MSKIVKQELKGTKCKYCNLKIDICDHCGSETVVSDSGCEHYHTKCIEKRVKLATIKPISREFTDEDYKNVMAMPKNKERTELGNVFDNTIKYVKKLLGAGE